ncbi:DUF4198 domain-containing protein [Undibacterium sp. TJN25]|uniref:DUF4198 domain-containing protein n=1 Tax=Undibacterium sp. TJN25 TaxID=3413056 RepID=UPI003BF30967
MAALLLLCCIPALPHEFWLVPHGPQARPADQVVFELRIGPTWPGVQTSRLPNLFSSFVMRDEIGEQEVKGRDGALSVGHARVRVPGAAVFALRTNPAKLELPAAEFEQYLKEEGLTEVTEFRQKNGLKNTDSRELFSRCAKTIVFVDGSSKGFNRVMNLPLELVPVTDPLQIKTREIFSMQLLFHGEPLQGVLVKAQLKAGKPVELTSFSDRQGIARFSLPSGGLWLFNAVHMESSMENSADWESLWASMTIDFPLR